MDWKQVIPALIIGLILGIGSTFFMMRIDTEHRITKLEIASQLSGGQNTSVSEKQKPENYGDDISPDLNSITNGTSSPIIDVNMISEKEDLDEIEVNGRIRINWLKGPRMKVLKIYLKGNDKRMIEFPNKIEKGSIVNMDFKGPAVLKTWWDDGTERYELQKIYSL